MSATLGPGTIVRWKGVSPECSCKPMHQPGVKVGVVVRTDCNVALVPDHNIVIQSRASPPLFYLARPDEIEPIDEWDASERDEARTIDVLIGAAL
jgi:hypothetical protein